MVAATREAIAHIPWSRLSELRGAPGEQAGNTGDRYAGSGEQQAAPRYDIRASWRTGLSGQWVGRLSCRDRHAERDRGNLGRAGITAPVRQVDGIVLAKPQRRHGAVEGNRNQLVQVAAAGRFVEDPVGLHRGAGPDDYDRVAAVEGGFDGFCERGAAFDHRIPPDA